MCRDRRHSTPGQLALHALAATGSGEAAHRLSENPYFWSTSTLAFSSLLPLCISSESCTLITISIITIKSGCNCSSTNRSHAGKYEIPDVHGHPAGVTVLTSAQVQSPFTVPSSQEEYLGVNYLWEVSRISSPHASITEIDFSSPRVSSQLLPSPVANIPRGPAETIPAGRALAPLPKLHFPSPGVVCHLKQPRGASRSFTF